MIAAVISVGKSGKTPASLLPSFGIQDVDWAAFIEIHARDDLTPESDLLE